MTTPPPGIKITLPGEAVDKVGENKEESAPLKLSTAWMIRPSNGG